MNIYLIYLLSLLAGYLTGSVLFAHIITKLVTGKDIRDLGNNNPGAANTFRSTGKFWGVLTLLLDTFKALIPILLANYYFDLSTISLGLIGAGAIIGHGYPLYYNFVGGRAAGTLMGTYAFFIPYELLGATIFVGLIMYFVFYKHMNFWTPLAVITVSATACLFFDHTVEVKSVIWANGMIGLYFNRAYLPFRIKAFRNNEGSI